MANYVLNNFVRQLSGGNIQLFDKYDINQININVFIITQNYIVENYIRIESSDNTVHIIDFNDSNEVILALAKLQVEIDIAKLGVSVGGGITDINAQLPLVYSNNILSINQATSTQSGYLSYTDYNILNNKQSPLNGTGFVVSNAGTISYDTNKYLTTLSASSIYLTTVSASTGYLTPESASSIYLTLASASSYVGGTSTVVYFIETGEYWGDATQSNGVNWNLHPDGSANFGNFVIDSHGTASSNGNYLLVSVNGITAGADGNVDIASGFGGVQQYTSSIYFPITGNPSILYVDKSVNLSWYWDAQSLTYSTIIDVFPNDIRVSLPNGKSFGKYASGATISSKGKTSVQVITEAIVEPIPPTVNISTSPSPLIFNQPNPIIVTINFGYTINSLGAATNTAVLQYYSNSSSTWNTITSIASTSSTSYSKTGFTYAIPNADNPQFNTTPFQFKYVVTDTLYASNSATSSVTINGYAAPSITFTGSASRINLSIESNNNREIGNTSTILKGSVSRNSIYVPIQYYQYFIKINNGSYTNISPTYSISSGGGSLLNFIDSSANSSATTVTYQVLVKDSYTTTTSTYTINYNYVIFYGAVITSSTNSSGVRSNSNYQFVNGTNPFILNTGTISRSYEIAFPPSHSPTIIIDLDALNAPLLNVTGGYFSNNFNVNDGGGTPSLYNIYNMVNAIPYPINHKHQITYN